MSAGLAGVVAGSSAICQCAEGLTYRGYAIEELASLASFEEVAHLLLVGHLPNQAQLESFKAQLQQYRELPMGVKKALRALGSGHPMDILKAGVVALGCLEAESLDFSDQYDKAVQILGSLPSMLLYWHHYHKHGKEISLQDHTSTAHFILERLREQEPLWVEVKAMDAMLILYAEHGFSASTFASRISASTLSDLHSCVATGIGTLKGRLHGGANEWAIQLLLEYPSVEEALKGLAKRLASKEKIMGFGHRLYKIADPRSAVGLELAQKLKGLGDPKLFDIALAIKDYMQKEKKLPDNIDFFGGLVYHYLKLPRLYYTPLFVMSRAAGWIAHVFEQRADNKIIRPNSDYTGPARCSFKPIAWCSKASRSSDRWRWWLWH